MFGNLADWQTYTAARGDRAPTQSPAADQAAALQRGDDYIRIHYVAHFAAGVEPSDAGVAAALAEATYVAASLELATPGLFSATFTPADQKALVEVGDLKWELVQGNEALSAAALAQPRSTTIDALLAPYLASRARGPGALIA